MHWQNAYTLLRKRKKYGWRARIVDKWNADRIFIRQQWWWITYRFNIEDVMGDTWIWWVYVEAWWEKRLNRYIIAYTKVFRKWREKKITLTFCFFFFLTYLSCFFSILLSAYYIHHTWLNREIQEFPFY